MIVQKDFESAMKAAKEQFEKVLESSSKEKSVSSDELPPYQKELKRLEEIEMARREKEEKEFLVIQEMMKEFDMKDTRAKNNLIEAKNKEKSKMLRAMSKIEENRLISEETRQRKLVEIATNYVNKLQKIESQCKMRESKLQESVSKKRKEFEEQVKRMKQVRESNFHERKEKLELQKMKYIDKLKHVEEFKQEKLKQLEERIQEINEHRNNVLEQHQNINLEAVIRNRKTGGVVGVGWEAENERVSVAREGRG